jgi:hypothetical protein
VSRSGVTLTAARLIGLDRESAARFSFLLAMPIIAGAGLSKAVDVAHTGLHGYGPQFFWGFVASAISGFVVIWFLLRYLRRHDFWSSCLPAGGGGVSARPDRLVFARRRSTYPTGVSRRQDRRRPRSRNRRLRAATASGASPERQAKVIFPAAAQSALPDPARSRRR